MLGKNLPAPLRSRGSKDGKDPQKEEQSHMVEELAQRGCSCPWEFWGHLWKKPWRPALSGLTLLWGGRWTRDHQDCLPIGNIFNRNSSFYHFPLHFNGISHQGKQKGVFKAAVGSHPFPLVSQRQFCLCHTTDVQGQGLVCGCRYLWAQAGLSSHYCCRSLNTNL